MSLMRIEIENQYLVDLYEGNNVQGKPKFQKSVIKAFLKTIRMLESSPNPEFLYKIKSLNYESLKGDKKGLFSVRINKQYRLEFKQRDENSLTVISIVELSNHYK